MDQRQQVIINNLTPIMQHDEAVSLSTSYLHDIQNAYSLIKFISHNGLHVDFIGFIDDLITIELGIIHLACYRGGIYHDNQGVSKFDAKDLLQSQFPTISLDSVTPSKYVCSLFENIYYLYGMDVSVTYKIHRILHSSLNSTESMALYIPSNWYTLWNSQYDSLSTFSNICENLNFQIYNLKQRDIHTSIEEF